MCQGKSCLTLARHQILAGSIQHPVHRLMRRVIAPGDLAQGLPLRHALQDRGPLGRRDFEEGNRWVHMPLLRQRQGYAEARAASS